MPDAMTPAPGLPYTLAFLLVATTVLLWWLNRKR